MQPVLFALALAPRLRPNHPTHHHPRLDTTCCHDETGEFIKLVPAAQTLALIHEWERQTRVYALTDTSQVKERHDSALENMQDILSSFQNVQAVDHLRRITLGLFAGQENVRAISLVDLSATGTFIVRNMVLHPTENNIPHLSSAAFRMMCGLHSLAAKIPLAMDMEPLKQVNKGRFWLAGVSLLEADECYVDVDDVDVL